MKRTFLYIKWRRDRDSNSGYLAARQFSRLLQSTTLPSLRRDVRGVYRGVSICQNYFRKIFEIPRTSSSKYIFLAHLHLSKLASKKYIFPWISCFWDIFRSIDHGSLPVYLYHGTWASDLRWSLIRVFRVSRRYGEYEGRGNSGWEYWQIDRILKTVKIKKQIWCYHWSSILDSLTFAPHLHSPNYSLRGICYMFHFYLWLVAYSRSSSRDIYRYL